MENPKKDKNFDATVDGEAIEVPRKGSTPNSVLRIAHLDPEERYLIEIRGDQHISYKDNADETLKVHNKQVFITARRGPVPVS